MKWIPVEESLPERVVFVDGWLSNNSRSTDLVFVEGQWFEPVSNVELDEEEDEPETFVFDVFNDNGEPHIRTSFVLVETDIVKVTHWCPILAPETEPKSMGPHSIRDDFIQLGDEKKLALAWVEPASPFSSPVPLPQVRAHPDQEWSEPVWVRLRDGTLLLGFFPQADTYEEITQSGIAEWKED